MRISRSAALIGALAALSGWMARGIQFNDGEGTPPRAQIAASRAVDTIEDEVPLRIVTPSYASRATRGTRNLFAYADQPRPPLHAPPVAAPAPPPVIVEPVVAPLVEERPRARFTHRYIGRFGTDRQPIAAFVRDGEVVTVRAGERIDERFILREIGIESVQVEASVDGEVQSQRVSFDERLR